MKSLLKSLLQMLSDVFYFILDVIIIVLISGVRNPSKKVHHDKPVNVLANGPSLPEDFDIESYDYCMLNNSPISDLFWKLRPQYYILCDPLYFVPQLGEKQQKVISMLRERLNWNITLFVPYCYRKRAVAIFKGMSVTIVPFRGGVYRDISNRSMKLFLYKHALALPRVQNVVIGAIGCLMREGFKEINLYGVDHSWTSALMVNQDNVVCLRDSHYYDKDVKFTPWYKINGEPYKFHECLRDIAQMFASYWDLRLYADNIGVRIYNCTQNSFIDAFVRKLI